MLMLPWLSGLGWSQCYNAETLLPLLPEWGSSENILSLGDFVNRVPGMGLVYQGRFYRLKDTPEVTPIGLTYKNQGNPLTFRFWGDNCIPPDAEIESPFSPLSWVSSTQVGPYTIEEEYSFVPTVTVDGFYAYYHVDNQPDRESILSFVSIPYAPMAIFGMDQNGYDGSGAGALGTPVNMTFGPDRHGRPNSAGYLNGVDAHFSTNIMTNQTIGSPGFTVALWVYPTSVSPARVQLVSTDNGDFDWSILREGNEWYVFTGTSSYPTGATVDLNTWQHIAASFNPATGQIMFHKNASNTALISEMGFEGGTSTVTIGANPGGMNERFKGYVDDVLIYGFVVDINGIDALYIADTLGVDFPVQE